MNKKFLFYLLPLVIFFVWFIFINPAKMLSESKIKQVSVALLLPPDKSLSDLGYKVEDCVSENDDPIRYFCRIKGKALIKIKNAIRKKGRSYYTITSNNNTKGALYSLTFKLSDTTGYTFIIDEVEQESSGKFTGYYYDTKNQDERWIVYVNSDLGNVLADLRK